MPEDTLFIDYEGDTVRFVWRDGSILIETTDNNGRYGSPEPATIRVLLDPRQVIGLKAFLLGEAPTTPLSEVD